MKNVPTILITYNRPSHTKQVLDALKQNNIKNLYIFSDAPKTDKDNIAVNQVRELIKFIDWTIPEVIYQKENQGLAKSIINAVDTVFEKHDKLILLEDDCIPHKYFFDFMYACLSKYENYKRIFGINGYTVPISDKQIQDYPYDVYFYQRIGSWGWATWKDRWVHYNRNIQELLDEVKAKKIPLNKVGNDIPIQIEKYLRGELKDVWTLNWLLAVLLKGGYYIYPTSSHIENIGYDGTGLHSGNSDLFKTVTAERAPKNFPDEIVLNKILINNYLKYFGGPVTNDVGGLASFRSKNIFSVCHINTQDMQGGAAKVAWRLTEHLKKIEIDSKILVGYKNSNENFVSSFELNKAGSVPQDLLYYNYYGSFGLIKSKEIINSDILHLHNLHGDYFNPFSIINISRLKSTVWTLHDMQAITGHCAHSFDCEKWKTGCNSCPYLSVYPAIPFDTTAALWNDKKKIYEQSELTIVVPSIWLKEKVEKSILNNFNLELIYNGIPTDVFKSNDRTYVRRKYKIPENFIVIGIVADGGADNIWKGGKYVYNSIDFITQKIKNVLFLNVGGNSNHNNPHIVNIPSIVDEEQLVEVYSLMDIFLYPSIADNCPLVVIEAISCGIPVVGFKTGGIPEIIENGKEGFIVEYLSQEELNKALLRLTSDEKLRKSFSISAREKAVKYFDHQITAEKYQRLYESILNPHRIKESKYSSLLKQIFLQNNLDVLSVLPGTEAADSNDIQNAIAVVEIEKGNYERAGEILDKILSVSPENVLARANKYYLEFRKLERKVVNTTSMIKFSVITPSYNQGKFIEQTIQSVINQNYANYEHIILDGGSSDETIEILKKYPHLMWISEKDRGQSDALNKGFELATGEIIAWINSDDWYEPNAFSAVAKFFEENQDKNVVMGNCNLVDVNGNIFDRVINAERGFEELKNYKVSRSIPTQPAIFFRKKLLEEFGLLDINLNYVMDYDLWMRFAKKNRFYHLGQTFANYRFHQDAKIGDNNWEKVFPECEIVRQRYVPAEEDPMVSVIIPCYNYARYLPEAVESVVNQTYKNFEIIIVNDGSTDNTKEAAEALIQKYSNYKIKFISQANSGLPAVSRNKGISEASGEYILPLDADDKIDSNMLMECVREMQGGSPNRIIYTARQDFDGNNSVVIPYVYNFERLKRENFMSYCSLFQKKMWKSIGGYRTNAGMEDWDFWIAAGLKGYYGTLIPKPLFFYRRHDSGQFQRDSKNIHKILATIIINNKTAYDEEELALARQYLALLKETQLVSVIIPTFNRPDKLKEAIASVLKQDYDAYEIIVVNDAGEDVSGVINSFNDKRIKLINHSANKGLAAARNTGLKNAHGKYIAYLDDDDVYYPEHLRTLLSFLEQGNYKIAYTDAYRATQELQNGEYITVKKDVPFSNDFSKEKLLRLNIAPVQCFMHEKACVDETGYFDESLKAHEDWDFWIRLAQKYEFYHIKKITSEFRQRTDKSNMTSSQNRDFYNSYRDIVAKHYILNKDNPELLAEQVNNLGIIKQRAVQAGQMQESGGLIEVSIIIPVYNKVELTRQCLLTLYKNTPAEIDFEVIVIDNASNDGTGQYLEFAKNIFDNLSVITNRENIGFARANNLGVKNAEGEFVLFLNNDTEPLSGWLENLLEVIRNDKKVAAVGSKLLFPDGSLQHAGVIIIEDKQLPDPLVARHIYWKAPADIPEANKLKIYHALTAACLLVRKKNFDEVDEFDEAYWNGYEDVDLCFKLGEAGYKMVYQPASVVVHHESQSGQERFAKVNHNIERLHKKWLGKIKPDFILEKNSEGIQTDAGFIRDYITPKTTDRNKTSDKKNTNLFDASIIVLTYNGLEYTRQFLESIKKNTKVKYELILVDNCSSDGTVEFLKKFVKDKSGTKLILNEKNLGFPGGVNQGLKIASGKYIVIANNDIIVTKGWLERMIEVAESDEKTGLVGPVSNSVSGVQIDKDAEYPDIEKMHEYAGRAAKKYKGQIIQFPRVAFLCTLIKREVIDKIGGLDERFSPGNYEDDDFCLRAQQAGYKTIIAKDVFIHHYGSKSFTADGVDKYKERLEINQKIFVDKWGATPEEIWLKGKKIKERNIMYALNKNEFTENLERALSLVEEKDYSAALRHLNNSISNYPEYDHGAQDVELAYLLNLAGNVSLIAGDVSGAQKYFEKALNEDSTSSYACSGLGDVLFNERNYRGAKTMYEWSLKNNVNNEAAATGLIKVNKLLNLPAADNSLLNASVSGVSEAVFEEVKPDPNELISEAFDLFGEKQFTRALEKLNQAERLFNGQLSHPTDNGFASSFHNMRGFNYLGLNDLENAKSCFEKALNLDPNSSQACAGLGETLFLEGHDEAAKAMFEWAVKNNPENMFAVGGLRKVNRLLNYPENHSSLNKNGAEEISMKIAHRDDFGTLFNKLGLKGRGAEIGVQTGVYSQTLRQSWEGRELYLIDRWKFDPGYKDIANIPDEEQKENYMIVVEKFIDDDSVQIIRKDSLEAAKQFPDEFFDWLYLDADHSLEGCANDLRAWYPKLKTGGIFAGHDYIDGEFIGGVFGVKSAVDGFISGLNTGLYLTEETPLKSWYFVKPADKVNLPSGIVNEDKHVNSAEQEKLQSVLNELLEASFELFGMKCYSDALETLNKSEGLFYSQQREELISSFENIKGFNYLGLNDKESARQCFEKALNLNPASSQACAGLGEVLYLSGKDEDSKTMYEYAVKNNPGNKFAAAGLAKVNKLLRLPENHNSLMH